MTAAVCDLRLVSVMSSEVACRAEALCEGWRHLKFKSGDLIRSLPVRSTSGLPVYVAASPAAPFSTTLRFARNDNHVVLVAPQDRAHRRAVASGNFQRQRRQIINTGSNLAQN